MKLLSQDRRNTRIKGALGLSVGLAKPVTDELLEAQCEQAC